MKKTVSSNRHRPWLLCMALVAALAIGTMTQTADAVQDDCPKCLADLGCQGGTLTCASFNCKGDFVMCMTLK